MDSTVEYPPTYLQTLVKSEPRIHFIIPFHMTLLRKLLIGTLDLLGMFPAET
jgi:hypothetical protein